MPELDEIADELDRRARLVARTGDRLVHEAAAALWTSAAADAFRALVDRRRDGYSTAADGLARAALEARHFAVAVAAEKARLRALAAMPDHAVSALARLAGRL